jgi:hypothetical protein
MVAVASSRTRSDTGRQQQRWAAQDQAAAYVSMASQKICRDLGIGHFPRVWSYLGADD